MSSNLVRAIFAGLVATAAMTLLMLIAPMMGMPKMLIGNMLAGFMGIPVAMGWVAHFVIGVVLAILYATLFVNRLPGSAAVRGALFSLVPWLLAQLIINPMMGAGVFASNTPAPMMMVMGSLLGHLVYGVVLGVVFARGGAAQPALGH